MSGLLDDALGRINRIRAFALAVTVAIRLNRALCLGGVMLTLWAAVRPEEEVNGIILGFLVFLLGLTFQVRSHFHRISKDQLVLALDMNYPQAHTSPFKLNKENPDGAVVNEWNGYVADEVKSMRSFENKRLLFLMSSMPIPLVFLLVASLYQPKALSGVFQKVGDVVDRLKYGASMTLMSGAPGETQPKVLDLSSGETHQFELLTQNMVEIKVIDGNGLSPRVELRKKNEGEVPDPSSEVYQSFMLVPIRGESDRGYGVYKVAFSVKEDVHVYVPTVSRSVPVASIDVRTLPVPKVALEVSRKILKPWPDDKPLPLRIRVKARNPLKQVRLVISAEGRSSTEIVSNILVNDKKALTTEYNLILETYVQSDISQVEIVAEAVDRAVPIPLVGRSEALVVETASAYGRYRRTLQTLRQIKEFLDEGVKETNPNLDPEIVKLAEKALKQSQDSPFFDGLDRANIATYAAKIRENQRNPSFVKVLEIQENLNNFLFEHETLDDKERDRDFFVAARALSRLIEKDKKQRAISMEAVTQRIKTYLNERQKRWGLRVKYLESEPPSWPEIRQRPFSKAMDRIQSLDSKGKPENKSMALTTLSQAVAKYRGWIDELEELEEKTRKQKEQERQEGLASARQKLKELQKRQGKIAQKLDRASEQNESDLSDQWPSTRMMQNTNIEGTASLEGQLRALSPRASERIKAALKAMKATVEAGNQKAFSQAESAGDMAGRLLRQAQSEAQKSQRRGGRKERRRRVTGDKYYGSQIIGGDIEIKREYSVDRRYREEILDEISDSKNRVNDKEDAKFLEDYLRKVVR